MEGYIFKRIELNNLHDLVAVVEKLTKKRYSISYFEKKYQTPWAGGKYHGRVAYDAQSGKAVAVVGALPFIAVLPDGSQIPVTQIIESFTVPKHSGRGLMTQLTKEILKEHQNDGTQLFFAITNQNNVHGFVKKIGFSHMGNMVYYTFKISTFPLEAICRRLRIPGLFRWWAKRVIAPFIAPNNVLPLPSSALLEGCAGILHDTRFFNYKTFSFNKLCRFSGIDSWLKFESGLLIGDVGLPENCPDSQFNEWLSTLQKIARQSGLKQLVFQVHPDSQLNQNLSTRFTPNQSWSVCCLATDENMKPLLEKMRFVYGDFDTF